MLGWATGDSIVSDVAKDHALLTKFFFLPCPFAPFVPCRLWTVLHLQISLKFYGFPWLVVCDSHGFHKGSKIQHKPSIANLSLNYLESHNGSGKNERTTAAQPRAKRRVFFKIHDPLFA